MSVFAIKLSIQRVKCIELLTRPYTHIVYKTIIFNLIIDENKIINTDQEKRLRNPSPHTTQKNTCARVFIKSFNRTVRFLRV